MEDNMNSEHVHTYTWRFFLFIALFPFLLIILVRYRQSVSTLSPESGVDILDHFPFFYYFDSFFGCFSKILYIICPYGKVLLSCNLQGLYWWWGGGDCFSCFLSRYLLPWQSPPVAWQYFSLDVNGNQHNISYICKNMHTTSTHLDEHAYLFLCCESALASCGSRSSSGSGFSCLMTKNCTILQLK